MNNYVPHENKIKKNVKPENFLQNAKQVFPCRSLESFSRDYYNMENKILGFQFEPLCAKQTRPNYSVGSDQSEAEIQYDRLIRQERCNYEKMRTSFECVWCYEIPEVKAFPWKCKAKLSWNIAVLDFFAKYVELNCKGNHFLGELFSEIS